MSDIRLIRLDLRGTSSGGASEALEGTSSRHGLTPERLEEVLSEELNGRNPIFLSDGDLPVPSDELIERLLAGPGDVWHGGLRLGLGGQPTVIDHVLPKWMLNLPVDPDHEVTSWRMSFRAVLFRSEVLEQLGGPDGGFETLTGASLELGMRWIRGGALMRHVPELVPAGAVADLPPSHADAVRMLVKHQGRMWAGWTSLRAAVTGSAPLREVVSAIGEIRATAPIETRTYTPPERTAGRTDRSVSVVLPTIDRYDHLIPLLGQLAEQTVPPKEVLIVDQTRPSRRRHDLASVIPGLPVDVQVLEEPGQCTARNLALERASGEFVLFIDDDDEIGPDLIASHLERLVEGVDAISGGVDDATAGPPPPGFRHRRASDTFPTNNTMVRRSALERSGWFDPAFDRGPRADHDLGIRLHRAGAFLVYDPSVMVFHHHAPVGGLRTHGARAVTRASARRSLVQRNLPAPTELALGHRYATSRQRREAKAIAVLSTLSGDGGIARRVARMAVQLVLLPSTLRRLKSADREARKMGPPPVPRTDRA